MSFIFLVLHIRTNNKGIWNYRTNTRGGIGQLFTEDGTLTQDDREAAEVLNKHFFKTFTKEDTTNIPHITPKNLTTETLTTFEITEELVKKCLLQLKTDKSPGNDGINPRILKEMSEQLCVPLNIIFKLSIDASTLPRQWRDAIICPIYKKIWKKKHSKLQASVPYIHRLQDYGESECSAACRTYQDEPPGLWSTTWLHYLEKRKHKFIRSIEHLKVGLDWCTTYPLMSSTSITRRH